MKRIKTIDTFRGWCIFMMVFGHMLSWWVRSEDRWLTSTLHSIFGDIVGTGFLFVSGLSAVLFFKNRLIKAEASEDINIEQVNNEFLSSSVEAKRILNNDLTNVFRFQQEYYKRFYNWKNMGKNWENFLKGVIQVKRNK